MSKWAECTEEGHVFYISEDGNVAKLAEDIFVAIVPATVKLGPFSTVDEAKQAVDRNKETLRQYLENYNDSLVGTTTTLKI